MTLFLKSFYREIHEKTGLANEITNKITLFHPKREIVRRTVLFINKQNVNVQVADLLINTGSV